MMDDILYEQFEYLVSNHHGQCGIVGCPECIRMAVIEDFLRMPFMQPAEVLEMTA